MAFLGNFQLGEYVTGNLQTWGSGNTEGTASSAPTISVYKDSDTPILSAIKCAPQDKPTTIGWHSYSFFLDTNFSAGRYIVRGTWTVSGSQRSAVQFFVVEPGGNVKGAAIGLYFYHRPHADYVIQYSDGGDLEYRRNPRTIQ